MAQTADLYRMATEGHLCPYGLKARGLLKRRGFDVRDHRLTSRAETDAFRAAHDVETTPQVFIDGERVGGYSELRDRFGLGPETTTGTTYTPVIAIFATGLLMALAVAWTSLGTLASVRTGELFIAISMCLLGVMKLRDLVGFSYQFLGYDLLAQRMPRYAYVYPFVETGAGVLMIANAAIWLAAPAALFIGTVGAVSVFKAVYVDRRELKCACVGGDSDVPLGFVSLTENLMMVAMAVWMLVT